MDNDVEMWNNACGAKGFHTVNTVIHTRVFGTFPAQKSAQVPVFMGLTLTTRARYRKPTKNEAREKVRISPGKIMYQMQKPGNTDDIRETEGYAMQGKVEICGVNTSKLTTLSNAEMMTLIARAQQGDSEARSRLVEGNLKLVLSVVQRFMSRGENPDDLFQVGCIGLLKAIANFDTTKNVRFSTYGVPMIAGELRRYLRDYSPIRVSRSLRDTAYRVLQCKQQLTEKTGREPTLAEIAAALELPEEQITAAMDAITAPVSLYEPVYSEGGDALTVMDQVRDRKNTDEQWIESITLREAIAQLPAREKRILALRFENGRTQMEVAGQIGISQAQVSRLEKSAIRSIRKAILPS